MEERSIENLSLDGGCPCFDFVNTVNSRKQFEYDYLESYEHLLAWCKRTGTLPDSRIRKLSNLAKGNGKGASHVLTRAKKTREAMFGVFFNLRLQKNIPFAILDEFNAALADALSHLRLTATGGKPEIVWPEEPSLEEPLWYIMKSCFDVLTQEEPERMKECEGCGWLFLDKSKNKKRRWCNMQVCGSHDKALRYYYRMKEK